MNSVCKFKTHDGRALHLANKIISLHRIGAMATFTLMICLKEKQKHVNWKKAVLNSRKRCQRLGSRQDGETGCTQVITQHRKRVKKKGPIIRIRGRQDCNPVLKVTPHGECLSNIIGRIQRQLKNSTPFYNCQAQDFITFLVLNSKRKIRAMVG